MSPYRCFDNNVRVFYEEYRHPRRNCIGEVRNYGNKLFLFYFQNKLNCQSEQDNLTSLFLRVCKKFSLDDYGLAL